MDRRRQIADQQIAGHQIAGLQITDHRSQIDRSKDHWIFYHGITIVNLGVAIRDHGITIACHQLFGTYQLRTLHNVLRSFLCVIADLAIASAHTTWCITPRNCIMLRVDLAI